MPKRSRNTVEVQTPTPMRVGDVVRERLLDTAERLFAERGFHGASVRDITDAAGLRLAAINYHFGSKEQLFVAVLSRRATELHRERLSMLAVAMGAGGRRVRARQLKAIVVSFVAPVQVRAGRRDGWSSYFSLVAQIANSRLPVLKQVAPSYNDLARAYVEALSIVVPTASRRALQQAYQLMLASTLYTFADNRRLDSLTAGALRSNDVTALTDDLVEWATAGITRLCEARRVPPTSETARLVFST